MPYEIELEIEEFSSAYLELERALNGLCSVPYAGYGGASDSKAMTEFLARFDRVRQFVRDYSMMLEKDLGAISEAIVHLDEVDVRAAKIFQADIEEVRSDRAYFADPLFAPIEVEKTGEEMISEQKRSERDFADRGVHFGV